MFEIEVIQELKPNDEILEILAEQNKVVLHLFNNIKILK